MEFSEFLCDVSRGYNDCTCTKSFEVVQKVSGSKTAKATTASLVEGGSGAGLLIACIGCVVGNHCGKGRDRNLYRKDKKEKGEN